MRRTWVCKRKLIVYCGAQVRWGSGAGMLTRECRWQRRAKTPAVQRRDRASAACSVWKSRRRATGRWARMVSDQWRGRRGRAPRKGCRS
eukprot:2627766-Prymnesium_polylepis.2